MRRRSPQLRVRAPISGQLIREALSINFYMRRPHQEVAPAVMRSLERYRRVVGEGVLSQYLYEGGYWEELDDAAWEALSREMLGERSAIIELRETASSTKQYRFDYWGTLVDAPDDDPKSVCAASFWLPPEYLEEHGPAHVRELAMDLAEPLPFSSGHAGFAFSCDLDLLGVTEVVTKLWFLYPGLDLPRMRSHVLHLGTRVSTTSWLTFLGQPVLGELGGTAGLRAWLPSQDICVQELGRERAIITLGEWPEAGEEGRMPPAYRELARVLEPWLFHEKYLPNPDYTEEDLRRWERRFLE